MNYLSMIDYNNLYSLNFGSDIFTPIGNILYADGTKGTFLQPSSSNSKYKISFVLNSLMLKAQEEQKEVIGVVFRNGSHYDVYTPAKYDFIIFGGVHLEFQANNLLNFGYDNPSVDSAPYDYLQFGLSDSSEYLNTFQSFDEYAYTYYSGEFENSYAIYDFTSLQEDTLYYTKDNFGFHTHYIYVDDYYGDLSLQYGVGSPYARIREDGYQSGFGKGYLDGKRDGEEIGFQNAQNTGTTNDVGTAFSYIGSAFNGVAGLMAIEVLPHITLGLCFSIPLTIVLCMTIFKLIKK